MEKSTAILIRRTKLSDTSLVITWCSESHGLIKTVAKGALRPKSPFAGLLDLFFTADIIWSPSRRSDLHTLTDVNLANPRLGIRRSYAQTIAAGYFCDCLGQSAETDTPIPELHDLLTRGLDFLDKEKITARAVRHFELQLATLLGIAGESPVPGEKRPHSHVLSALGNHFAKVPRQRRELENLLNLDKS